MLVPLPPPLPSFSHTHNLTPSHLTWLLSRYWRVSGRALRVGPCRCRPGSKSCSFLRSPSSSTAPSTNRFVPFCFSYQLVDYIDYTLTSHIRSLCFRPALRCAGDCSKTVLRRHGTLACSFDHGDQGDLLQLVTNIESVYLLPPSFLLHSSFLLRTGDLP